jgi:tyrosyl-tRNA synthetase
MKSAEEQLELVVSNTVEVKTRELLLKKLEKGKPLRIKFGVDPTAPDLHLGHTVPLSKLRQFQDLGHRAVLIIGDFTSMIGDPSGRNSTRPQLARDEVAANAKTYQEQACKILDKSKTELVFNGDWFGKMAFADIVKLCSRVSLSQMLVRRDFRERLESKGEIRLHEVLYPVMQAWDSVMVKADVEIGGTDQLFNIMLGRDLQEQEGQEGQVGLFLPLLEGVDGAQKMSKSLNNHVGITEPAADIFGKTMSVSDELMWRWYGVLLGKTDKEIAELKRGHPMEAKKSLAHALTARFHGQTAADEARAGFEKVFSKREDPATAPALQVPGDSPTILELVVLSGVVESKSEARRLISQGGVSVGGSKVTNPQDKPKIKAGDILQVGKRHFFKLVR